MVLEYFIQLVSIWLSGKAYLKQKRRIGKKNQQCSIGDNIADGCIFLYELRIAKNISSNKRIYSYIVLSR